MLNSSSPLADYHVHPDFSFDAEGSIDDYCRTAIEKELAEICFTTHYDTNPMLPELDRSIRISGRLVPNSIENMKHYIKAVLKAQEEYNPLIVKCGIEVGYYPGCEEEIFRLFKAYDFDYRLGAVHEVGDFNICSRKHFEKYLPDVSLEEFGDRYFELLKRAAESRLFDVLAHPDIYKWLGSHYYGEGVQTLHRGRIERVFEVMRDSDVGLEINTSGLRKGTGEYFPSMEIINMARSSGIKIMALGSDSHKPSDLAFDFETAASIAYELFPYCDE